MHQSEEKNEGRFRKRPAATESERRSFVIRISLWLVGAIIASIVPFTVSLWALSLAEDYVPMLKQSTAAAAAGSAVVVAVAFSVALFLQLYVYWKIGPSAGRDANAPIKGRWHFLTVYLLVPLVAGLAAGYFRLSPMTRLSNTIDWIRQPSGLRVERQVGQTVRDATAGDTRVAGLRALAQFGSPDALNELARLAARDPRLLNDPASFDALTNALASFGGQAEPELQRIWNEAGRATAEAASAAEKTPADLVLAVYNRLDAITDTASAYALAREAVAAPASTPPRQAAAIALIAKSGSSSDVALLASYLVDRPESVKQAALDGLRELDARLRTREVPLATNASTPARR